LRRLACATLVYGHPLLAFHLLVDQDNWNWTVLIG
jgi:hypothetical protein